MILFVSLVLNRCFNLHIIFHDLVGLLVDFVNIIEKTFLDCLGSVMYSVGHRPNGVRENYVRAKLLNQSGLGLQLCQ